MSAKPAKQEDSSRPQYLVIFQEPSESNEKTLKKVLNRDRSQKTREGTGVTYLEAASTGVETKIYHPLGIAAADLSEEEKSKLDEKDEVEKVIENKIRLLPLVWPTEISGTDPPQTTAPTTATGGTTWGLQAIGLDTASAPPTGKGVKVAVLDTGIDLNHPDFKDRLVEGVSARSFVAGFSVQDTNGHGTHCAGTICGPLNSEGEIRYGVAPDAELLVGRVFNQGVLRPTATDDDILDAITWAAENGARIINLSFASIRDTGADFPLQYERIARRLFNRPTNSILLVAAAGNHSQRPTTFASVENPAACPSIMAVAAVDREQRIYSRSCKTLDDIGFVDVAAPGVGVYSSTSSTTGEKFKELDGTSMAAPHVAGLAALYLERNPSMTAPQLFEELKAHARHLGDASDFGTGLVQL